MLNNIEAVIFDMDGTIVDSMWIWEQIDVDYLGRFGISLPDDLQRAVEGMSFSETAEYFKQRFSIADSVEKIKEDWNAMAYELYQHKVDFKEGALAFIQHLKKRNIKTGIATSNSRELVETVMNGRGAGHLFDSIRTACEVEKGKPSPDIYNLVAEDLGVNRKNCLVFEDVVQGIMAGKNAGMKVCAVYDDFSRAQDREKQEVSDYYIRSFLEIDIQDKE